MIVDTTSAPSVPPATPVATMTGVLAQRKERFLPVTRTAIVDRLSQHAAWPSGNAADARRFYRYLEYWRQQSYVARLGALERDYEPFSPDSDLLVTRRFSTQERASMQKRVVAGVTRLLEQANYNRLAPEHLDIIMKASSHYGLELVCDMAAFDEVLVYYRGQTATKATRWARKKLFPTKQEFEVATFQRLVVLFKLKAFDDRVQEVMISDKLDQKAAEKLVTQRRGLLGGAVSEQNIYVKMFKNIPQSDLEMCFPNTNIKFRTLDKLRLTATAGGGLGAGVFGAAGKIALLSTNPVAAAGAAIGLGGVAFRQAKNVMNQKNKYMITMAQNLYSHALADNRGVLALLSDRAAEEDVKEEMLLYGVLAKETVHISQLDQVDEAIERYLKAAFSIDTDFDVSDALGRLIADGIVTQRADGSLATLSPIDAASRIDQLWDSYLDRLVDHPQSDGEELAEAEATPMQAVPA